MVKPRVFILDVDGVMTDGQFHYSLDGKVMKVFGADDSDALSLLSPHLDIHFVTGDHRGFDISKKRIVDDMRQSLDLVSTIKRIDWIKERWNPEEVIYMGDGIFDHYVFKEVLYSIAPKNGDEYVKKVADYVTKRKGGDRAVAEASLHILEKFFRPYNPNELPDNQIKLSGEWTV
ncbi:HAD hydrolase family protein [Marinomonas colpomeniae]|uniref:HAD hydrolase family protein n=1 Tax=Marinomonas colpomeniae TaxID=2774408 RepID=A0ABR8NYJ2_9GAMM|nr:HAD hydrolase family protein [Marinomonas colpomeniae]MBD5771110.1 HAD hydrolase family protein [Marinomonas colpomeniae]